MDKIETVWKMRECSMQEVKELAYELEIPIPVAQVMLTRGIDSVEKAEQFLDLKINKLHDPTTLPDAEIAIKRISKAIGGFLSCKSELGVGTTFTINMTGEVKMENEEKEEIKPKNRSNKRDL